MSSQVTLPGLPRFARRERLRQDWPVVGPRKRETRMIPIDLSGKVALVTGVGDDKSFAWFIAKALQAAGARLVLAVHPRMIRIVEGFLTGEGPDDVQSRVLPFGAGSLSGSSTCLARIAPLARRDTGRERLMSVPGIGPIISSAMVAVTCSCA